MQKSQQENIIEQEGRGEERKDGIKSNGIQSKDKRERDGASGFLYVRHTSF